MLKLLVVDSSRRLSAAQVQLHPWVTRVRDVPKHTLRDGGCPSAATPV